MLPFTENRIQQFIVAFLVISIACLYTGFLTFSQGNILAMFVQTIPIALLGFSVVFPRMALLAIMLLAPLFGYFKKLLLIGGDFPYITLAFLFSVPLVFMLGACIGAALSILLSRPVPSDSLRAMVIYACTCILFMILMRLAKQGLPLIITAGSFINLIWVLFHFSRDPKFCIRLQAYALVGLFISSTVGIYQHFFGLTHFDLAYIETGYLVTQEGAYDPYNPRPFATYGTPAQYGWAMCFAVVLCLFGFRGANWEKPNLRWKWRILGAVYFSLMVLTAVKKGPLVGLLVFPVVFWAIGSARNTLVLVMMAAAAIASCVMFEHQIIDQLRILSEYTTRIDRNLTLNTFSVRVESFAQALDPSLVRFIGPTDAAGMASHNLLSRIVYGIGLIPALILLVGGGIAAVVIQPFLQKFVAGPFGLQVRAFIAFVGALALAAIVGTNTYATFPVSFYMGLSGALALLYARGKFLQTPTYDAILEVPEPPPAGPMLATVRHQSYH